MVLISFRDVLFARNFYPWMPFVNHQIVVHISTRVVDGGVRVVEVLSSGWNPV